MAALAAWIDSQSLWVLGALLVLLFWSAAFVGRLLHRERAEGGGSDAGLIVSASLALLGLLLGFTVSMAVGRYDLRRQATLVEANAIGTFLYRTSLLPAEVRATTLDGLETYVEARLRVGRMGESAAGVAEAKAATQAAAQRMWTDVVLAEKVLDDPARKLLIVESANMMFDMATARDAALANRLPATLVLLLLFFPVASLVLIGYASGRSVGVHLMASTELILLMTLVLLLIADLNRPRSGTILTPMGPIEDVRDQLAAARAAGVPAVQRG